MLGVGVGVTVVVEAAGAATVETACVVGFTVLTGAAVVVVVLPQPRTQVNRITQAIVKGTIPVMIFFKGNSNKVNLQRECQTAKRAG